LFPQVPLFGKIDSIAVSISMLPQLSQRLNINASRLEIRIER